MPNPRKGNAGQSGNDRRAMARSRPGATFLVKTTMREAITTTSAQSQRTWLCRWRGRRPVSPDRDRQRRRAPCGAAHRPGPHALFWTWTGRASRGDLNNVLIREVVGCHCTAGAALNTHQQVKAWRPLFGQKPSDRRCGNIDLRGESGGRLSMLTKVLFQFHVATIAMWQIDLSTGNLPTGAGGNLQTGKYGAHGKSHS